MFKPKKIKDWFKGWNSDAVGKVVVYPEFHVISSLGLNKGRFKVIQTTLADNIEELYNLICVGRELYLNQELADTLNWVLNNKHIYREG